MTRLSVVSVVVIAAEGAWYAAIFATLPRRSACHTVRVATLFLPQPLSH
jgi:hypothetical protein